MTGRILCIVPRVLGRVLLAVVCLRRTPAVDESWDGNRRFQYRVHGPSRAAVGHLLRVAINIYDHVFVRGSRGRSRMGLALPSERFPLCPMGQPHAR